MGYIHIDNLYKNKEILMFKKCYALEKIHGISSHITFKAPNQLHCHHKLFNRVKLLTSFKKYFNSTVIIYGELYGDNIQHMRNTYGNVRKFIAFDVKIDGMWLCVPDAEAVCNKLGLEFVDYKLISTTIKAINIERDRYSVQSVRNNMAFNNFREGIILRPLIELTKNNDDRIIAKHKNQQFRETKTPRLISNKQLQVLKDADAIAEEWVTAERLNHVLSRLEINNIDLKLMGIVIQTMIDDVYREGKDELIESTATRKAIAKKTYQLYKAYKG